jgi:hypothetical protein
LYRGVRNEVGPNLFSLLRINFVSSSPRAKWVLGGVVFTALPFYKRVRHVEGILATLSGLLVSPGFIHENFLFICEEINCWF